ncbi:splicing factor 3B subunit 10-domain-containing protein [Daldinia eschscholtzii]|nr:splicing factor 3B subunit 10-domain-containing protein [Daldinia eschscholtzii]
MPRNPLLGLTIIAIVTRPSENGLKTADKLRTQQELERLQAKYIGTGHPDTTSWEWRTNVARDTYSSLVGHPSQLAYISLAQNEPAAKVRAQLLRKMIQPCGPPPPREGEEPIRGHN